MNALADLSAAGVAVWLDDLSRESLQSGELAELVRTRHVVGVTTNPSIFEKSLSEGEAYDDQVRELALLGVDVGEAVRAVTTYDVRWACDVLREVYDATDGVDGRVSIEVDPRIAHDTDRTVAAAKALWWLVDRPNLFIKIPATREGIPAVTQVLAEGISVNVTLIFSLERYDAVMEAFLAGMEQANASGRDLPAVGSVASFFVSRVDTEIDARLDKIDGGHELRGKAAIANARLAYAHHEQAFASDRWQALEQAGAKRQRPLWASTGVKDPQYDDTRYVVELVAPGTVNTMPGATLEAVFDHGTVRGDTVTSMYADAQQVLDRLSESGIDYDDVVQVIEDEGVRKFEDAWAGLIESVTEQLRKAGRDVENGTGPSPARQVPATADEQAGTLGIVGLGRMGANMAERLRRAGHDVVGYDRSSESSRDATSLEELVQALPAPRLVWVMLPAGDPTSGTIDALRDLLDGGDVVVDGGNSRYTDDQRHGSALAERGIGFLDVGVSGGVWGLDEGYALTVGGTAEDVAKVQPFFDTLKPEGEFGFVHAGPVGAGHFAKMVHNGIEYGLMQSYAEGWELLQATDVVTEVTSVFRSWKQGTVIRSWLLDLLVDALDQDGDLSQLRGYAQDSGEGRWTIEAAVEHAVPLPVITAALYARFASRQDDAPAMKVVAALRNQFGGHQVTSARGSSDLGADSPGADAGQGEPPATRRS